MYKYPYIPLFSLYPSIYIYTYIYTYIFTHTYIYTYISVHIYVEIWRFIVYPLYHHCIPLYSHSKTSQFYFQTMKISITDHPFSAQEEVTLGRASRGRCLAAESASECWMRGEMKPVGTNGRVKQKPNERWGFSWITRKNGRFGFWRWPQNLGDGGRNYNCRVFGQKKGNFQQGNFGFEPTNIDLHNLTRTANRAFCTLILANFSSKYEDSFEFCFSLAKLL